MENQQEGQELEIIVEGGGTTTREDENNRITDENHEFNQFDMISTDIPNAVSDHHYAASSTTPDNKKVMKEWKILGKDLPDSIYVRVFESRIDLLRAVIIGPTGTPYHDGLFFFDIQLPSDYPNSPPSVYYRSFGIRLNPNLYGNGKVCLSLLNTWMGHKNEKWNPTQSTLLQVLLSLQGLVLNAHPYFNEPGLGMFGAKSSSYGQKSSMHYSEQVFMLSLRTMLRLLNKAPKHFEGFVARHFRDRDRIILAACKAYMGGRLRIGEDLTQIIDQPSATAAAPIYAVRENEFLNPMQKIYPKLVKAFLKNGSSGLDEYLEGHNNVEVGVGVNIAEVDDNTALEAIPEPNPWCCLMFLLLIVLLVIGIAFLCGGIVSNRRRRMI